MSSTPPADPPKHKTQECDRCKAAGFAEQPIYFEKIGEDPATGKIKWKVCNPDGSEHKHKGNQQRGYRPPKRVAEILAQTNDVAKVNALLKASKDNAIIATVPGLSDASPVWYVVARMEAGS